MSLFSAIFLSSAVFEIPTGVFSDIIGRKKTVVLGAVSATASAVCYAVGGGYWILFAGAILEGISRAWYSGNNDALLFESVLGSKGEPQTFAHHLGRTSSMFQLALMTGAVVGSIIAEWSFLLIMWLSVVPQLLCVGISLFLKDPVFQKKGYANVFSHLRLSARHLLSNPRLKLLSIQDILAFGIGESSFIFSAAFIGQLWPVWAIGLSRMISYGGAFISFRASGRIIRRLGEYNVLIAANVYSRFSNLVAYGFPSVLSPVLIAQSSIWYGANQVAKTTLMQREYSAGQRATLSSITSLLGSIFFSIFSPILGLAADLFGPAKALIMVQVCMLSVLYVNIKLKSMHTVQSSDV
jgi:MFS family permease